MQTATGSTNGAIATARRATGSAESSSYVHLPARRPQIGRVFAATVACYLTRVLPLANAEIRRWTEKARAIPDAGLRGVAFQALAKRGNIEGGALFATLAPAAHRTATVRALVAFQSAYNYLDALSERPSGDPGANAEQLHEALLLALHPRARHRDYYARNAGSEDGGYLVAMLDTCRDALGELPSFPAVATRAREAAARIVDFQTLNRSRADGGHAGKERWADDLRAHQGLDWWEIAAAAGSSLSVHALIAAAADPQTAPADATAIDEAYFPSIGALHSLLDSLVDRREDAEQRQPTLLEHYPTSAQLLAGMSRLAVSSSAATARLRRSDAHTVILTAMCSYYLSAPECDTAEGHAVTAAITRALGLPLSVAIASFRARRAIHALTGRGYR
jgi:tetraprenyl-beta-curcumene synthase